MSDLPRIIVASRDISRCLSDSGKLKFPIPLSDGLLPIVSRMVAATRPNGSPYPITPICKDWRGTEFVGCLMRYADHADIFYSKELNRCWRRFVVCKELSHLAFDGNADWTTDYSGLAQQLITDTSFASASNSRQSEDLCTLGAMELLIPWQLRSQLEAMLAQGKTDYEVAKECLVPESFVNLMLRSEYGKWSASIHKFIDDKGDGWNVDPNALNQVR